MDGWITIGTKLDTVKFEKQLKELENKINDEEKKQQSLNEKTEEYKSKISDVNTEVETLTNKLNEAKENAKALSNALEKARSDRAKASVLIGIEKQYKEEVKTVAELSAELKEAENEQSKLNSKIEKTNIQYEKSIKTVDKLKDKIDLISLKRQQTALKNIENGITSSIKKVGKLALAVLSVRSAYSLLRRASSTWGQYNEQYAKDLEYIRFALAYGLAPILEKIVNLVATLMTYVNYLANAWFGKKIFASAKDFQNMAKSASGVAKSTKEIKNNLASFDELSILNQSLAEGGTGNGFLTPSFDLANFENIEVPQWIKWFGDNGDTVKKSLIGIGTALGALKLSEIATNLGLVATKLSLIKAAGIGVAVKGVVDGVEDLKKYADDPSLENLGKTISDIGEATVGVGVATGNLAIIAGGSLVVLVGKFVENWDEIKETTQDGIDYLREKSPEIEKIFGKTGRDIYEDVLDTSQDVLDTVDTTLNSFNNIVYDFIQILDALANNDWKTAWEKFRDIFKQIWESISSIIGTQINVVLRFINFMIERAENFINDFIDGLNSLGASISHVNFNTIPLLGKGDVISTPTIQSSIYGPEVPGRQTKTPTLENPVYGPEAPTSQPQNIVIKFAGTVSQFVRSLKPELDAESKRAGVQIITGGAS